MVTLSRVRPEEEPRVPAASARSFGALVVDEATLNEILGGVLTPRSTGAFDRALSPQGQACIKGYWEATARAAASPRRPALNAPPAAPPTPAAAAAGGAGPRAFLAAAAALLPGLAPWQLRDLWAALDGGGAGRAPHPRLALFTALVAAAASGRQLAALHALGGAIHSAFAAGAAPLRGLRAAVLLLGAPPARLHAAAEELGLGGAGALTPEASGASPLHARRAWLAPRAPRPLPPEGSESSLLLFAALQSSKQHAAWEPAAAAAAAAPAEAAAWGPGARPASGSQWAP
ncbi:hypothetical protein Rsub_12783 [Raphidocelis subcapitata]|uniref:Uncharacterized protein n=1 Tax=Raphidocelis subcapitata TaxID=307507 RepID=A0A2V0PJN2_9CHLO|nr:hypothetical protein Rsub_12783 [Raphidocelis subcapitata]|eukprot:GBG00005.1 hypothetical protein Rsub_12783 [Raphidocelis subcapitata]